MSKKLRRHLRASMQQSNRIIFAAGPGSSCSVCRKGSLVVAERDESLRCFHCGSGFADPLCWFCESGISGDLLAVGRVPSCLRGHTSGWIKFCEDFTAGSSFGADWKHDIGERRKLAENLFSKMKLESCGFCKHRNTDNVIKPMSQGRIVESQAEINEILASGRVVELYQDPDAAFCERHESAFGPSGGCGRFSPSTKNSFYQEQKTKLPRYLQALQFLELLYPQHAAREIHRRGADDNE